MAKNIFQTKKRVSHFQKTHKDLEGENELFGCKDYVSSIIQDMDSNFTYIQSGYSKKSIEYNGNNFTAPEDTFLSIPLLEMPSPSSSKGSLQIPARPAKSKRFSLSRKFPLMEKSQKILKQLKHNQNIPKPRAHLAGIPKSPAKSKAKYIPPKISAVKKKEIQNVQSKVVSKPHCKVPSKHSLVSNIKNSNLSEILKDNLAAKHSKPKKNEDNTSGKGLVRDIPTNIDCIVKHNKSKNVEDNTSGKDSVRDSPTNNESNKETNSILESDSGTSDGEYERFVKKNKKGLQKKVSKKKKQNTRKSKSCTRSLKRKKPQVSEQKNMHDCDSVTKSRNSKISPCKKQKTVQDDTYFENDSNSFDCDVPDMPTRDSSSESDDDSVTTSKTQQMISQTREVKPAGETIVLSGASTSQSYVNFSVSESNMNSVTSSEENEFVNSVQLKVNHSGEKEIFPGTNLHQSHLNFDVLESNVNSGKVQSEFSNENCLSSIKIERDSVPSNFVIDICDSDDECSNDKLNAFELSSSENVLCTSVDKSTKDLADSEESDIEIIEEVEKPVQTMDKCSVLTNVPNISKNVVSSEKQLYVENEFAGVKPSVKIEDLDNKSLVNILPVVKSRIKTENVDKQDVVYKTDICHTKMILEQRTIISHCSKTQNVPTKGSFQANPDLTLVKHETSSDDEIIILDSVRDASNLPSAKTVNIKSELSTSEDKLKLLDTIVTEPKTDEMNEWEKKMKDVIPVSSTELLEWYKMEFETYMEMKQANADVEASLKNLQARQAQKMRYVRNLLHKCVKSQQPKPLPGSAPLPVAEPSKNSKDFTSVNVQNNCDITPNNSFSLSPQMVSSSNAVQDIKPDVNKLKEGVLPADIKPKIESDDKQTLKLLNEKCSVCGKDAVAACQRCAKVFFCSHECGRKFWIEGHVKVCGTK